MTGQQLKNSILQEAIEGRLVPQDPNDEPASVLLERIRAEKARLVKEKKIKKDKNESRIYRTDDGHWMEHFEDKNREDVCIDEEIPFDVPNGWEWERWGNISQSIQYGYNAPALETGIVRMVRISDIQENKVLWESVPFCNIKESEIDNYVLRPNDILFARTGGTVGKSFLVKEIPYKSIYAGYLIRTRYSNMLKAEYLKFYMESRLYWEQLRNGTIATAQPNCNGQTLSKMFVPIPPIAEQHRIVEKIESLLSKVEAYGKAQEELEKLNEALPEQLKKSILQEAIEGRLVPQDPNDEPASVLLERIRAEKARLVKEKKIKKDSWKETDVSEDEKNFDIPYTWEWCKLGVIFQHASGKQLKGTDQEGELRQYITTSNLYWDKFELDDLKSMYYKDSELERCSAQKGDLLVCEGGDVGRSAIWPYDYNICLQNHVHKLRPYIKGYTRYVYYVIWFYKNIGLIGGKGIGIKGLSASALKDISIPLPPLAEQHRIVEKIESLLPKIENLKVKK